MKPLKLVFFLGVLHFYCLNAVAQNESDTTFVLIETQEGNRYTGKISSQNSEQIILSTQNLGEIVIQKKNIKSTTLISGSQLKEGELWFDNPQSTRYFWAPNGFGLKKGEGYYQNIWVLWNQFAYGVTDNFSVGGAIVPLFLFGGLPTPVFISPKISIPVAKDKFNIGAGALIGTVVGEIETGFGILYGVSTLGSPEKNLSLSMGYGFSGGDWASSPLVNISGMIRLSPKWYFLTENYYLGFSGESAGIISAGARWIIKKAALDFGLFAPIGAETNILIAIPWVGFTIPFGNVI